MHVASIWRYPVKSMVGEEIDAAELGVHGIVGDRTWATRDLERGGIRGAKQLGGLMRFAAVATCDGHARIRFPDGSEVSTAEPDASDRLSAALGHPVVLEPLRPADDLEHYRRGGPDHADVMDELRAVFGREPDEPLPDFSVFPPEVAEFESPPGTYHDCYPLMVMTTSALGALESALPEADTDVRRFRPSFVVETGDEPGHPEFGWTGRSARIGSAEIEFLDPCPRCVMITREVVDGIPQDRSVLRHVVRELDQNLGVYARITTPGSIHVGDSLEWI